MSENRKPRAVHAGPSELPEVRTSLAQRASNNVWQQNFLRMAQRAATDPRFYEIAGSGVQQLADEIRAGGAVSAA